jgi:hypothetical protein
MEVGLGLLAAKGSKGQYLVFEKANGYQIAGQRTVQLGQDRIQHFFED